MKIWFLTTEYPPYYGGGIGTYMQHAAQMFAGAGHEVTVFVPGLERTEELQSARLRLLRFRSGVNDLESAAPGPEPDDHPAFPFNVMSHWPALSYQFALQVREFIAREGPPDVIEAQDYGGISYYLLQEKLLGYPGLAGVPVLVHLHAPTFELLPENQYPDYRLPEYWVERMEKFCVLAADRRVCPSNFLRRRVLGSLSAGGAELDIDVVPLPFQPPELEANGAGIEEGVLVCIGRLQLCKGTLPLLASCDRLWREGEQFRLVLVGGDTEFYARGITVGEYLRRRYERWIEDGRLELTGNLTPDQCAVQRARARAILVPSLYENFPMTCVEAMHAGKVVIASSSGGQGEMIGNEDCGYVFDWSETGSLERCIKKVLRLTPAEIKATGSRARARIRQLTAYENVLPRRMEIFEQMKGQIAEKRIFPSVNQFAMLPLPRQAEEEYAPDLLSVIIPYYNMGQYVDDALQSALRSAYRPLEILIVNDGSTESRSLDKLREIEAAGRDGVRVLHIENRGLASVRNFGAARARGEFLAFLDADDMVEPDFYSRSINVLKKYHNVSLVYSWVRYFEGANGCFISNNLEFPFLLAHNMAAVICVLKRADFLAFARNKPLMSYGLEDFESWISLYESGRLGVCIPEMLARYRVRPDSMLRSMNEDQVLYMYDEIVRLHAQSYKQFGDELFRLLSANGASFAWNSPGDNWQSAEKRLRWSAERLRAVEEEVRTLRERVANLEWAEEQLRYFSDPANMGLKTALRGLGCGLKRKTRQMLKSPVNRLKGNN
ncbi:glycosyltransferase [Pelotomaculum propionicicum]|uniref:Putative glycosyltransferase EpsH n=1 Tax=Pelotomaculum propionicicum TaxID=258475 RepID=A0A4Y7RM17_9FIRM|nr:glycosyltransferase [Pelotomaculum propionicicum]TEB09722.1 putative glycosyltransferase EpsH [Pelotomaculum propionicicum]